MKTVEMRPLGREDYIAHRRLMSQAFGRGGVVDPNAEPQDSPNDVIGFFDGQSLLSALTICPFTVHWPGAKSTLSLGGIAGVATHVEARGQNYVDRLLTASLERMRDAGQVISALYPFAWSFYRKYGWDWVGEKREITLPLRELPKAPRKAEFCADATAELLNDRYNAYAAGYRGAFTASCHNLEGKLSHSDNRTTYAYTTDDGYLLWRYPNGDDAAEVREYVTTTPDSDRAFLQLLRDFGMQHAKAKLTLPANHPMACYLTHWDVETKAVPVFSGRVVDVAAALSSLTTTAPDGAVTLFVSDPHAPWNDGTWTVTVKAGQVCCTRSTETPQLTLSIATLSQAFWGTPSLETLRRAGSITVTHEAGFSLLAQILPPMPVMCWNFF